MARSRGALIFASGLVRFLKQTHDRFLQCRQVVVHRRLQDGVRGVEVAMGQQVTQARDLDLGDLAFGGQQALGQRLDRLADLDETNPDGVEHQTVAGIATREMRGDRTDRG